MYVVPDTACGPPIVRVYTCTYKVCSLGTCTRVHVHVRPAICVDM